MKVFVVSKRYYNGIAPYGEYCSTPVKIFITEKLADEYAKKQEKVKKNSDDEYDYIDVEFDELDSIVGNGLFA